MTTHVMLALRNDEGWMVNCGQGGEKPQSEPAREGGVAEQHH
jgi:hypothetical protein